MNPVIKELAAKASLGGAKFDDVVYYVGTEETFSKFAEAVVRECLEQVDKVEAMLDDDKEKTGVAWVGLAIAKHFGVE